MKKNLQKKSDNQTEDNHIHAIILCKRFPLFDFLLFAKVFRKVCENPYLLHVKPCDIKACILIKTEQVIHRYVKYLG